MHPPTIVELSDVSGKPRVKLDLPAPLRIGDRLELRFRLTRQHGGRSEALDVQGTFRITALHIDASSGVGRQHLSVEALEAPPSWRAVKKSLHPPKPLGPTKRKVLVIE